MAAHLHELVEHIRFADILDVCVVAVLVYASLRWLRRRASRGFAIGLILILVLYLAAHLLDMYLTLFTFRIGATAILISMVIVFQQDIRRTFERLSTWRLFRGDRLAAPARATDVLMEAVSKLADEKVGALFVIQGRQPLEHYVRGGILVGGQISVPLLHSICHPNSQGHDGAVLIEDGLIQKLGVHLPLSKNFAEVGPFGTRHAAALGLAECSDALVIVVSEERGTVSVAEKSSLRQLQSLSELKHGLDEFYREQGGTSGNQASDKPWRHNVGMKVVSTATACVLWFLFAYDVGTIQRSFPDVPIEFRNLRDGWILLNHSPAVAEVTLSGSAPAFNELSPTLLKVAIDLSDIGGAREVELTEEHFTVPSGLSVEQFSPTVIRVNVQRLVSVDLPVQIVLADQTILDRRKLVATSSPARIRLLVPESTRTLFREIETERIDDSLIADGQSTKIKLVLPAGTKIAAESESQVTVHFQGKSPDAS